MKINSYLKNINAGYFLLIASFFIAEFFINPVGNFPMNDDWSYTWAVENLVHSGVLKLHDWTAMTLFSQVLYGGIVTLIFGFSETVLRFGVCFLGLISVLILYKLAFNLTKSIYISVGIGIVLMANPIYLEMTNTFMTVIPFTFFSLLSILYCIKVLDDDEGSWKYFLAVIFCLLAVLNRQVGLYIPIAFFLTILATGISKRLLYKAIILLLISLLALHTYYSYLDYFGIKPALMGIKESKLINFYLNADINLVVINFFKNLLTCFSYLSLFILPITLLTSSARNFLYLTIVFILSLLVQYFLQVNQITFPWLTNNINIYGIGPRTIYDMFILQRGHHIFVEFWTLLSFISIFSSFMVLITLAKGLMVIKLVEVRKSTIFIFFSIITYLTPIILSRDYLDEYLIPVLPLFILMYITICKNQLIPSTTQSNTYFFSLIFAMLLLSMIGLSDYFAWSRVKWAAIQTLQQQGISDNLIDGGFEFSGKYLWADGTFTRHNHSGLSWWAKDNTYLISGSVLEGFNIYREYEYKSLVPPNNRKLFILKKVPN